MNIYRLMLLAFLMLTFTAVPAHASDACFECHANAERMKAAGAPQFTFTDEEIRFQSKMPAVCSDCHLGNPAANDKTSAHEGMLRSRFVKQKGLEAVTREKLDPSDLKDSPGLSPRGEKRYSQLLPKRKDSGKMKEIPAYRALIYHDKNPETLAFNPVAAEKTCGKCHTEIVKTFLKSSMGGAKGAHTQSQYITWTGRTGPQSCGLWLGRLTKPGQEKFNDHNVRNFNLHSTMQTKEATAYTMQRNCNTCHVGCLDCHLDMREKGHDTANGPHTFVAKPSPLSCYGGGRSFSCHAGPLERRRGDGYLRAEFTQASTEGIEKLNRRPDIHLQKGISCVDCHEPNRKTGYHADLRRDVDCGKCHSKVLKSYRSGPHRNVDCAACHTAMIGGYAFNFWTAVGDNPTTRIQDYLTDAVPPLIIRNPKGIWIPVHVVPHTSGNVKAGEVRLSRKLLFRNRPDSAVDRRYFSNDSYAVTGLVKRVDEKDNDVMVWLNLDRVAHATGRSRACGDCHDTAAQRIAVKFEGGSYKDVSEGEYSIIADRHGLRITDFRGPDGGKPAEGLLPFLEKWRLSGDFSLPKVKRRELYRRIEQDYRTGRFSH